MAITRECILFVFILIFGLNQSVKPENSFLPTKADLPLCLRALERLAQSAGTPRHKINANFGFGLFLANVNLKSAMLKKNSSLPIVMKAQIQRILNRIKILLTYFKFMRTHKYGNYEFTYLFIDEDTWANRLPQFNKVTEYDLQGFSYEYLTNEYSHWSWYEKRILDYENNIPNPEQSDTCFISLRWNTPNSRSQFYKCSTPSECQSFVENGSEFGYSLTHRVLFLLIARYSRGCYVFSPELDAALVDKMCASIYEEASYIVMNQYKSPDLLMEQISTCSLAGHTQFIQRMWLNRLLKLQTHFGCFTNFLNTVYNRVNPLAPPTVICNSHVSGVAAAALGGFTRFIVETYF